MMRQLLTIIILTLAFDCLGQLQFDKVKVSAQTKEIVERIETINELMGSAVGYAGEKPEQYDNFIALRKEASKEELIGLTNYPNSVVRCYAFWALCYDSSVHIFPIVLKHLADTAHVKTQFGCIGSREKVGDFFINLAIPHYVDLDSKKLTASELSTLDSILVYTPNTLYAKEEAIERIKPTEQLYLKVKELVTQEHNQAALVTLAKFQKEQDTYLILNNQTDDGFYFTCKAISEYPNPAFLPFLKKSLYNTLGESHYNPQWRALYNAVASYKNDTSLQLLTVPFTQVKHQDIREYHIQYVFEAVQSFYSPLYDELLWKMWSDEKLITPEVFKMLYKKDSKRAFQLTKQTIEYAGDFYYLVTGNYNNVKENKANLIDVMLDTVIIRDRSLATKLINENIRQINVHEFPTFANKAFKLKDISFVASLLHRLATEDNPHIYLKAAEVLIAFRDKNINRKIINAYHQNRNLHKDWGGQEFAKLLKENNLK